MSDQDKAFYLGLMSGTSVDGLDIALCEWSPQFSLITAQCFEFPEALRGTILEFCDDSPKKLDDLIKLDCEIARFAASSINYFLDQAGLRNHSIRAIGFHGQTLRHLPEYHSSLQCGNAALLAELTGIDVIADFRSRDLAAGGQGAPLVPAFHLSLSKQMGVDRCAFLNLGGIANLTLINDELVTGFDTGPANVLMDYWIAKSLGNTYDLNGNWAARGLLDEDLLNALQDPYFRLAPPKSTGRELFNANWLEARLKDFQSLPAETVQRTLLELTALSISDQLREFSDSLPETLYVCGGGAKNETLITRLRELLSNDGVSIKTTDALNLDPNWVEAAAFAWLAMQFIQKEPGNLPSVTGANGKRILGALYPA